MNFWRTKTTQMTNNEADSLTDSDRAALQLALDLTLADDPPDHGRVEQVTYFLREPKKYGRTWLETAEFCSYHQQMTRLNLYPWQSPPCWIVDLDQANAILARGPQAAMDGSDPDISDCQPARLLRQMLHRGVSPYHPDPLAAIAEARKRM